jgi:hypothetical protein
MAFTAPYAASKHAIEDTNTIRPPARRSAGSNACVTATCANTFTSNCLRSSSAVTSSSGPPTPMPALLTSASRPPREDAPGRAAS